MPSAIQRFVQLGPRKAPARRLMIHNLVMASMVYGNVAQCLLVDFQTSWRNLWVIKFNTSLGCSAINKSSSGIRKKPAGLLLYQGLLCNLGSTITCHCILRILVITSIGPLGSSRLIMSPKQPFFLHLTHPFLIMVAEKQGCWVKLRSKSPSMQIW